MAWYAVERRYRVRDFVYVEARTAKDAEQKVRDVDYEHLTEVEPIQTDRFYCKAERRQGVPRWVWREMGMPDDVTISET